VYIFWLRAGITSLTARLVGELDKSDSTTWAPDIPAQAPIVKIYRVSDFRRDTNLLQEMMMGLYLYSSALALCRGWFGG